jgi:hypothetical protein
MRGAPAATPFVSLYAHDRLVGCFGSDEGAPEERLSRAFLRSLDDTRHHPLSAADRPALLAHVAYPIAPLRFDPDRDLAQLELGTHGLVRVAPDRTAVLLPSVAADAGYDAAQLVESLAEKAGVLRRDLRDAPVFAFATETVATLDPVADTLGLARRWLAARVAKDGSATFGVDPRRRAETRVGAMHHGRAAVAVAALARTPAHAATVGRARARLRRDALAALRGRAIKGWPDTDDAVAGTLALLVLGGAIEQEVLVEWLRDHGPRSAWHAAQVVAAIGARAPEPLWLACVRALDEEPWAPWTLIAARRRGDHATIARVAPVVIERLAPHGPHAGGCVMTAIPEIALTALAVESLVGLPDTAARRAVDRGRAFLRRWQLTPSTLRGVQDPALALGAFPASPINDALRVDVTAHAVLALR